MDSDIRELTFQNVLDTVLKPAGVKVGGFPEEIFIDLSAEEIEEWNCSICFLVVKDCRECSNKHLFCHTCIFAWSLTFGSNSQCCPVCRCEQASYADSVAINSKLADKRVNCPVDGCSFRGPLKIFLLHSHGKQNFSNGHVDLDSLRPVRRQPRLLMPLIIGLPDGDYTNDVRAQLHQGRMVIHQMMALLQLEMQLRQRALDSFSVALDSQTRVDRLDEVLALNEQLNEVGNILSGLMHSERPRLTTAQLSSTHDDAPVAASRLLPIRQQRNSPARLSLYNVMPARANIIERERSPTPFTEELLSSPNTNSIDAALSSDDSPVPPTRTPFNERNESDREEILSRMQLSASGVSQGVSTATLNGMEPRQGNTPRNSVSTDNPCSGVNASRESLFTREATSTAQQSDPSSFRPESRSTSLLARNETHPVGNVNRLSVNALRIRPSLSSDTATSRSISFSINNRPTGLAPITRICSGGSQDRENSASSLRNGRLPSIDTTASISSNTNTEEESNTAPTRDENVAVREVSNEQPARDLERRAATVEPRRAEPRQSTSLINANARRLSLPRSNLTRSLSNQQRLNDECGLSTPISRHCTDAEGHSSSNASAVASTTRVTGRNSVPRTVNVSIFRQNRKPNKAKSNTTSRFSLGRPSQGTSLTSVRADTNDQSSNASGSIDSTHIPAAHSRNLKPIRRKRPPLSIVSGTANQLPASNTGQMTRPRRRSEIAQDLRQRQRKLDE